MHLHDFAIGDAYEEKIYVMKKYYSLLLLFTTMFAINSCAKDEQTISKQDWDEITFLRYDFTDSSLPPEHHRSYYIGIDKDSIRVRISCYGELLRREVFPCSQEIFDKTKATLASQDIRKVKQGKEPLVCGGTTDALSFFKGDDEQPFFSASIYGGVGTLSVRKGSPEMAFLQALPVSIESIIDKTRRHPQPPFTVVVPPRKENKTNQPMPETSPVFPGGKEDLQNDIHDEMQLPEELINRRFVANLTVEVVIDEEGKVNDAWVTKSNQKAIDSEVVRCLKKLSRWQPGQRNGKPAKMIYTFPISIIKD